MKSRSPRFSIDKKVLNDLKITARYYGVSISYLCELAIDFYKGKEYERKLQKKLHILYAKKQVKELKKTCEEQKYFKKQDIRGIVATIFSEFEWKRYIFSKWAKKFMALKWDFKICYSF